MRAPHIILLLFVACGTTTFAQAPARDSASRPLAAGTATISGVVVADEPNGRPIRRATLMLTPAGGVITVTRTTVTDDEGRFAFTQLPAGNYTGLRAGKPGFVPLVYGEKRPGGQGAPIALAEGQQMTTTLKLLRGGVITGTIRDASGNSAANVAVRASRIRIVNGERQPASLATIAASTDDRGVYRMFGLAPGDYLVLATPQVLVNAGDLHEVSEAELNWAQAQLQAAPGAGTFGGAAASPASPRAGHSLTYAPLYYPGTTDAGAATLVTIGGGVERSGIDFLAQFVPTATIQGTVVTPEGETPQNVQMNVIPKTDAVLLTPSLMFESMFGARTQVAGNRFTIAALKPGDYTLSVRAAGSAGQGGPPTLWANADISVSGQDQSDLVLQLQPGMTVSGRVTFEGRALQPPPDLSRVMIRLTAAPTATGMTVSLNPASAPVAADGTFTLGNVNPGRYLLAATVPGGGAPPGGGWQPKSAVVNGVDGVDTPFEIRPGQNIANVVVAFTDSLGEVSGTLTDASGKPAGDFSVILFTADPASRHARSRRVKQPIRADANGKFTFTTVAPGDYFIAALTDFDAADVANPVFLSQLEASALKVSLSEGEKKTQDLKLAGQ